MHRILLLFIVSCFSTIAAWSQCDPDQTAPVFDEPLPDEEVTVCLGDVDIPFPLTATDICDGSLNVFPVDDTTSTNGICNGGTIIRAWTAVDAAGNPTTFTQTINVLPDNEAPSTLYQPDDVIETCENGDYIAWARQERLNILGSAFDDCGVSDVRFSPEELETCSQVTVTFTLEDFCGNTTSVSAQYTLADLLPPVFDNLPEDMELGCSQSIPDVPDVTATDACSGVRDVVFLSQDDVEIDDGDNCNNIQFIRKWMAVDNCGNMVIDSQIIQLIDTIAPSFDLPFDVALECDEDINNLSVTGNIRNLSDNCDLIPSISRRDTIVEADGRNELQRIWTAVDACGNINNQIQRIIVKDTIPPTFVVPADVMVDCGEIGDFSVTGEPTMVMDNCDDDPEVTHEDIFTAGSCESGGAVERVWRVTDKAGNVTEQTQLISIEDDSAPEFTTAAEDVSVDCTNAASADAEFQAWIAAMGNAVASDNCTNPENLIWIAYNSGTTDPATLGQVGCADPELNIDRQQAVDFVVQDECGNVNTTTATFTITDNFAPVFAFCPPDTTVLANDGSCTANFQLVPPIVTETCGTTAGSYQFSITENIQSDLPNDRSVPVNTVRLDFPVNPSSNFANDSVALRIVLRNVDAEQETEFFNILAEDGIIIGQTELVTTQCGTSETIFTNISSAQINQWAGSNSQVTFFLEPNMPDGGGSTVNDICGGSEVQATLFFETLSPTDLTYEYQINGGVRQTFSPEIPVLQELSGMNTITYYATDCSGNTGSCSYEVNVLDTEPPNIICPNDTTLMFSGNACAATYQLPAPRFTEDNCNAGSTTTVTMPMDTQSALITFNFDPDLNDYLANDKDFTFTGLTANVANDVILTIAFRGDVDNGNAFFNIIGDDAVPITTTALGQSNVTAGDCNTFSITTITIPAMTYNTWAADGIITITANSNDAIPIPPGGPSDGVNPCAPDAINANGEPDGISVMFASLTYDNTQYEYFTMGSTTISPTIVDGDDALPEVEFNVGETEVFYVVEDASNNSDTCSFLITVVDEEVPVARCTGTTISINPSGIEADTLQAIDLDFGSTDNCGIDTMFLSPNVFDCSFANRDTVNVTLTVVDFSGNQSTCEAPVRIVAEAPEPSYFIPPCGGDSLFLFANPPASESNNAYTYSWSGPDGFVSNRQNPIITNIDQENAGSYQVTITGITACTAVGIAEVAINDIPIAPDIIAPDQICSSDELILMTSIAPEGVDVIYKWYSGIAPNGTLVGTTTSPSLSLGMPGVATMVSCYVVVEVDGCESSPSPTKMIEVVEQPDAIVIDPNPDPICEGESIDVLGTFVTGNDISYEWRGPNGYFSNAQIPPVITNASVNDDGIYTLIVKRGICVSEPANVVVTVRPKPNAPNLSVTGGRCEGDDLTLRMNVSNATVYRWIEPGGNIRTTATNELVIPDAGIELSGPWTGFVTQGGCDSDISTALQVNINPTPNLAVSANPNPICTGDDLQLNASPNLNGAIYEWSGPNNYLAVGQNPVVTNFREEQAGIYECKITTDMGCVNTKEIEVNSQTGVRITGISNSATTECLASPTDIRLVVTVFPPDDGTYTYKWEGPNRYSSTDSIAVIPNATEDDSGNYSVIVSNPASCSSEERTTTISLKDAPSTPITPLFSELTRPPFCEGEEMILATNAYSGTTVQYKWNTPLQGEVITTVPTLSIGELSINDSGEYAVVVNIDGCDSRPSGTIPVAVNIAPEIMASSNSPVCEGEQLELEADLIENAVYEWITPSDQMISGASPTFISADPTLHSGIFRVKAIVDGCASPEIAIDVEVNALPQVPMAVNNGPICIGEEGAELRLAVPAVTATTGATYTWYDKDFNIVGENIPNLVHTLDNFDAYGEGEFAFYVAASIKECPSDRSLATMAVFNEIPANTAYAGEDVTLCEAEPIELDAAAPSIGIGVWEQIAGETEGVVIANPDDPNTTIFGLGNSGTFVFNWKLSNGACEDYSTDQLTILVNPDAVANAGIDIDTCQVTSILLSADAPLVGQGRWTQPEAQRALGVTIDNIFDPDSKVEGLQAGNQYFFTWEILDGLCGETEDEVTIIVSNGFAYAGEDFNDCGDGCVNLNAAEPTSGVGMWTSTNDNISFNDPSNAMTLICDLDVGVNELIWTADNGACGTMSSDTVIINYQPSALAQNDTVAVAFAGIVEINAVSNDNLVSADFTITQMSDPSHGSLENFDDGTFEYQADPNFTGTDAFSYELCTAGCECSIAVVTINVGGENACAIPSIITPNKDGVNDQFIIPCLVDDTQFPDNELIVFNQWGDEVFRSRGYQNDWEGTYNSEDLPDGTYYYVLNFGDGSPTASGFVLISR